MAEDKFVMPDINGSWVNLSESGTESNAIITIMQDGTHLEGSFTDSKDGQTLVEAPMTGYIDIQGNVIFDIYFGRITSTNRLRLSSDQNLLEGTFSNNAGNQGNVQLRRKSQ